MPLLRRLAAWLKGDRLTIVAAVAGVLGIAAVTLAQDETFDWARIIGALLVTASGIGFGIRFGFGPPLNLPWVGAVAAKRALAALIIVVLLVAPVTAALVVVLVGAAQAAGDQPGWLVALGALFGAVMLVGVVVAGWMAARSVLGAGGEAVTNAHPALGDEDAAP